ncbi:HD domain-containing protein [Patescibacteria group bacterium]
MDLARYNKALHLAVIKHDGQFYTSRKEIPFIAHPLYVAEVIKEYGFDDDVVIAAMLHDIVEDTDVTIEDIESDFGERVGKLVDILTVDQKLNWQDRQPKTWDKMRTALPEAKAIKAADMLHHFILKKEDLDLGRRIEDLLGHTAEETKWKYENLLKALANGWSHPLLDETKKVYEEVKDSYL